MQTNPVVAPSGGDPAAELDQATDVEGEVGHPDLRSRPGETDRADDQSHGLFLYREHVFDRSPVPRAPALPRRMCAGSGRPGRRRRRWIWLMNPCRSRNVSFCCER